MNTTMEVKLKLLVDTLSNLIDATLYRQIIGSLMYLTNTRPDICFSVNTLSQFLVEPMISWQSRKQSSISLSIAEAEYIAACSASCEAIWLRKLLTGLFDLEMKATVILCDNQSCIKMTENPVFHYRSKHIEIRYHFICDKAQRGALKLQYISTDEQVADVLTKPLSHVKFEHFRDKLGIV
jgi:hypothetical protein